VPVAVILAAGLGSRLQSVHAGRPKGFVAVGGEPIIARSIAALRRAGIREFVFVVGWQADVYRAWLAESCRDARCVENPDYASTGSLRSLLLGAAAVPGRDVLIVESDLLYEPRAVELLLAAPARDTVLLSSFTGSGDEVWAYARPSGHLDRLTKLRADGPAPAGELVGLSRVSSALLDQLAATGATLSATAHYEDALTAVSAEHPIELLRVDDLVWCEIDDPNHLERARSLVWPRISALAAASS
jgi:2-aminoethylphosphonate-pyruvate transaminase